MDHSKRFIDKVIILGSGISINDLTQDEINYINNCKVVIAINKFSGFYDLKNIFPTHIYFHDMLGFKFYLYILKKFIKDDYPHISIITSKYLNNLTYFSTVGVLKCLFKDIFYYRAFSLIVFLIRFFNPGEKHIKIIKRSFNYIKVPKSFNIISIKISHWACRKDIWAKEISDTFFHFRGSLTTVLNYVSAMYPNKEIHCVGTDFNCGSYFYNDELSRLDVDHTDFTTQIVKEKNMHFSFHKIEEGTMDEKFPFILEMLKKSNNSIFCNNSNSLLIKKCGMDYKELC